jgi:hypothetical protein
MGFVSPASGNTESAGIHITPAQSKSSDPSEHSAHLSLPALRRERLVFSYSDL